MSEKFNREFIYTAPESILFDLSLSTNELRIYMIVRSFMDTTGSAYPSNRWLSDKLKIDPRNVQVAIAKLIEKGYLVRMQKDNRRHLRTNVTPIPETIVSHPEHDAGHHPPTIPSITPPTMPSITQLDQRSIISKTTTAKVVVNINNLQEKLRAAGHLVNPTILDKLLAEHGGEKLSAKIEMLCSKKAINNPEGWLRSALTNDFQNQTAAKPVEDIRRMVPDFEATQSLLAKQGAVVKSSSEVARRGLMQMKDALRGKYEH